MIRTLTTAALAAILLTSILLHSAGCCKQHQQHDADTHAAVADQPAPPAVVYTRVYSETFDDGPNGWFDVEGKEPFPSKSLKIEDGVVVSSSPWWVDYNHAPPGGGYLHLIMGLMTNPQWAKATEKTSGVNRFVPGDYPRDFTNARFTIRIKGDLDLRGAQCCLLLQGMVGDICSGWVLTGQPITVTKDWSDQTITAVYDPTQWKCLDSRHDKRNEYGTIPLKTILSDVNINMYIVLFPLNVAPRDKIPGDPNFLRAGADYVVDQSKLPEGHIMIDSVKIEFP